MVVEVGVALFITVRQEKTSHSPSHGQRVLDVFLRSEDCASLESIYSPST